MDLLFNCTDRPHCVYAFISSWTSGLFFGYYDECCELLHTSLCMDDFFISFRYISGVELLGHMVSVCLTLEETSKVLCEVIVRTILHSQCQCNNSSSSYTSTHCFKGE